MLKKALKFACLFLASVLVLALVHSLFFPKISHLRVKNPKETAFMKYRQKMWEKHGVQLAIKQTWVPLSRISPYIISAVPIAEDDKFWSHSGFDYDAIKVAFRKNLKKRRLKYGASTITQQLAKNLFLSPSKNPFRKIREVILTWRLERGLTKKRILELYLNVVEWGKGIFGAEAAARHYYGKHASELSPDEAAHLAIALPNPTRYNPLSRTKFIESRVREVLEIMAKRGVVKPEMNVQKGGQN